jgi:3-hydroxy-9,10-secoandrosta-1,3,5(10)-triene-9,17-dione monooxygenase reductase component
MDSSPECTPPSAVDRREMRTVLGHFVSGIVVITGADPEGPSGFTCQSFASLSLDPPLVMFSPSLTSVSWPRIRASGKFCVNVLAAEHADYSNTFARSGGDKFADVVWAPAPSGSPILEGVGAWIDCTLEGEHPGGDHTIVIGRVTGLGADPERLPLLYYRGNYGVTAPLPVEPAHEEEA